MLAHQELKFSEILSYREADRVYASYCLAFPREERRAEEGFRGLFSVPDARVLLIESESLELGYLVCWHLSGFVFIEHMEIFPESRGKGFGALVLAKLSGRYGNIILETEPVSLGRDAERRVLFYTRNNFKVLDRDYVQPSYGLDKKEQRLWLLANWFPWNLSEIKGEVYQKVYAVEGA